MLELLFGLFFGIWAGQQLPLPSVQIAIHNWWNSRSATAPTATATATETETDTSEVTDEDHDSTPIFTGNMPQLPMAAV
tara:strand:+ start:1359 stop:1595 length:237 start_codon:yes stop_codon:yes gene_type:complete